MNPRWIHKNFQEVFGREERKSLLEEGSSYAETCARTFHCSVWLNNKFQDIDDTISMEKKEDSKLILRPHPALWFWQVSER
jgi:hypothetical protein